MWYEPKKKTAPAKVPYTVRMFAEAKGLDLDSLKQHHVKQVEQYGHQGVMFTYMKVDGTMADRHRIRFQNGKVWDEDSKEPVSEPYGSWRLSGAREKGRLILVEGETDTLTAWTHDIPCLGIPGAGMSKVLRSEHLEGIKAVAIVKEPDSGGPVFVAGLSNKLREIGYTGSAGVIEIPEGLKDLNDLHLKYLTDPAGFIERLNQAVRLTAPLDYDMQSPPAIAYCPPTPGKSYLMTPVGNSERLIDTYGEHLAHVHEIGWLVWTGTRWKADDGEYLVQRYAKLIVRGMLAEAERMADARDDAGESDEASFTNFFDVDVLRKWALRCDGRAALKEMADLAKERVIRGSHEFDAHPLAFNVINGTLDLRTGELRPHDPADLITQLAPVAYDPKATAPTWEQFISEIMVGRQALVDFLRRFVGYTLTGSTKEQSFAILWGHGENGKSTFLEALRGLFGPEYARQSPASTLMQKKDAGGPNPDVARLRGARLVTAVEPEKGARLAEGIIKCMTGGDVVTARFLFKEFFEMVTTHKVLLATNHKPRVSGTGHAIWRRIHLVPFDASFAGRADKDMPTKLRAELPGILNWALQGCREWLERGLEPPAEVLAATAEYRRGEDRLADFWADCCVFDRKARVPCGELYEAYRRWSEPTGEKPMTLTAFGLVLAERGIHKPKLDRVAGKVVKVYLGIGLATGATGATGRAEVEFSTQPNNTGTPEAATSKTSTKPVTPVAPVAPAGFRVTRLGSGQEPMIPGGRALGAVARITRREGDKTTLMDGDTFEVLDTWTWYEQKAMAPGFTLTMPDGRIVREETEYTYLDEASVDLNSNEQIAKLVMQSGGLIWSKELKGRDIPLVFIKPDGKSLDKLSQGIAEAQGLDQQYVADRLLDGLNNRHQIYRRPKVDPDDARNDIDPPRELTDDDVPF